jgi:carbon-monoxide dehydrogenase large subunit
MSPIPRSRRSLPRTEGRRLLTGLGRYTADLAAPGACRMVVLRTPHAAAGIIGFGTEAAARMPGVRLVLTPDDAAIAALASFTSKIRRTAPDGRPNFVPPNRSLSTGADFVGDAMAAVVADTLAQAKDAAERSASRGSRRPR